LNKTALWYKLGVVNDQISAKELIATQHRYPYRWKKKPQEQLPPWGGLSFSNVT
jgi:hypothetical protein